MATINFTVTNRQLSDYYCRVYDRFAGGTVEAAGSPFALASGETSPQIQVKANGTGEGKISYRCDGGPSLDGVDVEDGSNVEI
jgi:hypothetical protein